MMNADFPTRSLNDLLRLDGRRAVVTGGAQGLGFAIAARLVEAGAHVVLGDIDGAAASRAARLLEERGGRASGCRLDVRDGGSVAAFMGYCQAEAGGLDIIVNNAGIYPVKDALSMSDEEWDATIDTNLRGTFLCSREAARLMRADTIAGTKAILNIVSTSGFRGRQGLVHYTASKHGVVGLTKSLALELGAYGIRVLALAPTLTRTPGIVERAAADGSALAGEVEKRIVETIPLGRASQPDDIARVAVFAVGELAGFMTGTLLCVDGGLTAF
jgi:NAD(P)-dependent dehydrogenase (short-subunit alcohol dehydrogenase family)